MTLKMDPLFQVNASEVSIAFPQQLSGQVSVVGELVGSLGHCGRICSVITDSSTHMTAMITVVQSVPPAVLCDCTTVNTIHTEQNHKINLPSPPNVNARRLCLRAKISLVLIGAQAHLMKDIEAYM